MRVVIDTNVRISALLFHGTPGELVRLLQPPSYLPLISKPLLRELETTLARRFRWLPHDIALASANIASHSLEVVPQAAIDICRDPDDNRVLECALAGRANAIITGDRDLLVLDPFEGIPILTIRQFLDRVHLPSSI